MNATNRNVNTPRGMMNRIFDHVARSNHVAQQLLEYVGLQDERQTVGKVIYHFNILDPAHRRYRSTVTFVEQVRN